MVQGRGLDLTTAPGYESQGEHVRRFVTRKTMFGVHRLYAMLTVADSLVQVIFPDYQSLFAGHACGSIFYSWF